MSKNLFDRLMQSYPRCSWVGHHGGEKRAIPPGAPIEDMVEHMRGLGHFDTHWYWCRDEEHPRHMHLSTAAPRTVTPPA